jgi:hypothetical protein
VPNERLSRNSAFDGARRVRHGSPHGLRPCCAGRLKRATGARESETNRERQVWGGAQRSRYGRPSPPSPQLPWLSTRPGAPEHATSPKVERFRRSGRCALVPVGGTIRLWAVFPRSADQEQQSSLGLAARSGAPGLTDTHHTANFTGGSRCIHPAFGLSWLYCRLMKYLGLDYPIYGVQVRGLARPEPHPTSIEQMAADYVDQIRMAQPEGPYFLLGWFHGDLLLFTSRVARPEDAVTPDMRIALGGPGAWTPFVHPDGWMPYVDGNIETYHIDCGHLQMFQPGTLAQVGPILAAKFQEVTGNESLSHRESRKR